MFAASLTSQSGRSGMMAPTGVPWRSLASTDFCFHCGVQLAEYQHELIEDQELRGCNEGRPRQR